MIRFRRTAAVLALAFGLAAATTASFAQQSPPSPAQPPGASQPDSARTIAEVESLLKTLKDDAERQKLIGQLELLLEARRREARAPGAARPAPGAAGEGIGGRLLAGLSDSIEWLSQDLVRSLHTIFDVRRLADWAADQVQRPDARARWIDVLWKVGVTLLAGLIVEYAVGRLLAPARRGVEARAGATVWRRILPRAGRTLLDLVPVLAFLAGAYAALTLVQPERAARLVALALINAYAAAAVVLVAGRLAFSPGTPPLRLFPLDDETANYLYVWLRRFANVAIYGYATASAARVLGVPEQGAAALLHVVGLFVALMAIVFALQNRTSVAKWLRGPAETPTSLRLVRARFADVWHVLAVIYVVGMYMVWALAIRGGFAFILQATVLTILLLVAARLALAALHRATTRIFALNEDLRRRYPGLEARANRYVPVLERVVALAIYVVAAFALLEVWGIDSFALLATDIGRGFTRGLVTSLLVIVVALLVWEMVSAWIERYLAREAAEGPAVSARARTLLPLLRTTVMVLLIAIVSLVVLSQFGVDIAPLLAGAGVVGLAIGFGSQSLVKDVITGVFILAEDQIAVGDVVKIGSHAGLVERLTLRTLWLRGLDGNVHVMPFSEVTTVENMTKDFSRYVFDVGVAYREDTDRVVEILREIGAEMQQDPQFGPLIVAPLDVLGVDSFGDSAVIIKAHITTRPIQQWTIGREFNRRMKKRFDAEGIEIPFPHRTLYFGVDKAGHAAPARVSVLDGTRQGEPERGGAAGARADAPPSGAARS